MATRRHKISLSLPPSPLPVEGDRERLQQVFANLLNNAQKYTPPGGNIEIRAEAAGDEICVVLRDDGVGIPPELLPDIFESFVQGRRRPHRLKGGLGLGLTVVRQITQLHGGTVEARPAPGGNGTEFVVRLPLGSRVPDTTSAPTAAVAHEPGDGQTVKRLLVVDDNADAAELLALVLEMDGHRVMIAHDGPAAIEAARSFRPHVVLLDLGLPGMDGYEVARQLRQDGGLPNVAIVAVTGYGRDEDRRSSLEAGFDRHLVKPVDPEAMKQVLRELPLQPE